MVTQRRLKEHESLFLAKMLIEEHGALALEHAKRHAIRLLEEADMEGGAAWMRVAQAVDMILEGQGLMEGHSAGTLH